MGFRRSFVGAWSSSCKPLGLGNQACSTSWLRKRDLARRDFTFLSLVPTLRHVTMLVDLGITLIAPFLRCPNDFIASTLPRLPGLGLGFGSSAGIHSLNRKPFLKHQLQSLCTRSFQALPQIEQILSPTLSLKTQHRKPLTLKTKKYSILDSRA